MSILRADLLAREGLPATRDLFLSGEPQQDRRKMRGVRRVVVPPRLGPAAPEDARETQVVFSRQLDPQQEATQKSR